MQFKRLGLTLFGALAGFMLLGATALADSPGYVTADVLNVRSGPSTEHKVLGQIVNGTQVSIISAEGDWFKISFRDGEAFVAAQYISKNLPIASRSGDAVRKGEEVIEYAKRFIGVPYRYGGNGPNAFDCSGYTKYVFSHFGIDLPRTARGQMSAGRAVTKSELEPGDLVIFRGGGHVGIYVGNNKYIHAPETGRKVSIDEMNRPLSAARRVL